MKITLGEKEIKQAVCLWLTETSDLYSEHEKVVVKVERGVSPLVQNPIHDDRVVTVEVEAIPL